MRQVLVCLGMVGERVSVVHHEHALYVDEPPLPGDVTFQDRGGEGSLPFLQGALADGGGIGRARSRCRGPQIDQDDGIGIRQARLPGRRSCHGSSSAFSVFRMPE
jgi:hypothetical protein